MLTLLKLVLAMWNWVHMMQHCILTAMVPLVWQYLRYWWYDTHSMFPKITYDRLSTPLRSGFSAVTLSPVCQPGGKTEDIHLIEIHTGVIVSGPHSAGIRRLPPKLWGHTIHKTITLCYHQAGFSLLLFIHLNLMLLAQVKVLDGDSWWPPKLYRPTTEPMNKNVPAQIRQPVPAHDWTDEQKCTRPDQTAGTGPLEVFSLTSSGPLMAQMENVHWLMA